MLSLLTPGLRRHRGGWVPGGAFRDQQQQRARRRGYWEARGPAAPKITGWAYAVAPGRFAGAPVVHLETRRAALTSIHLETPEAARTTITAH